MSILVTAFDSYDNWQENSSWVALTEYLKEHGASADLITRRYPVEFNAMRSRLEADLTRGVEGVIHLGQRPGARSLNLEAFCLNVASENFYGQHHELPPLIDGGPEAFRTACPVGIWCEHLRQSNVAAEVSYHAGTYLCNSLMYLTHAWLQVRALQVPVAFIHTPLTDEEAARHEGRYPGISRQILGESVRVIVELMRTIVATRVV